MLHFPLIFLNLLQFSLFSSFLDFLSQIYLFNNFPYTLECWYKVLKQQFWTQFADGDQLHIFLEIFSDLKKACNINVTHYPFPSRYIPLYKTYYLVGLYMNCSHIHPLFRNQAQHRNLAKKSNIITIFLPDVTGYSQISVYQTWHRF